MNRALKRNIPAESGRCGSAEMQSADDGKPDKAEEKTEGPASVPDPSDESEKTGEAEAQGKPGDSAQGVEKPQDIQQ